MHGSIASTARAATARLRNPLANNIFQPAIGLKIAAPRTAFAALSPHVRKCGPPLRRCNNPEHCKPLYTCSVCDRRRGNDSLYASTFNRILQYGFGECSRARRRVVRAQRLDQQQSRVAAAAHDRKGPAGVSTRVAATSRRLRSARPASR
jgi:hypothetical protein